MAHARKDIRDAVVSAVTGLATTGSNVTAGKMTPWSASDLPALNVLTPSEENEGPDTSTETRALTIVVEGRATAAGGVLDTLDGIADEVEAAIEASALGGAALYTGAEIELDSDADAPVGIIRIGYRLVYSYTAGG